MLIFSNNLTGNTPKRKQYEHPDLINTTLRREITQNLADCYESEVCSTPLSESSSVLSLNVSESNLPSKENSPKASKVSNII